MNRLIVSLILKLSWS